MAANREKARLLQAEKQQQREQQQQQQQGEQEEDDDGVKPTPSSRNGGRPRKKQTPNQPPPPSSSSSSSSSSTGEQRNTYQGYLPDSMMSAQQHDALNYREASLQAEDVMGRRIADHNKNNDDTSNSNAAPTDDDDDASDSDLPPTITLTESTKRYMLLPKSLSALPFTLKPNPRGKNLAPMKLYSRKAVRLLALRKHGGVDGMRDKRRKKGVESFERELATVKRKGVFDD
jgi:hypothetical protein